MSLAPARALLLSRTVHPAVTADAGLRFERAVPVPYFVPAGDVARVPLTNTGLGLTRDEWIRTRHAATVRALEARGLASSLAWWVAIAIMGHYAVETGWGRSEYDYALGNIRGANWSGPVHYLQGSDDASPAPYRAYGTLDDGVEDSVRLATGTTRDGTLVAGSRYQPSFLALLRSDGRGPYTVSADGRTVAFPIDVVQWYADLTRAGWHPYSEASQATYRSTVTRVAQTVGAPSPGVTAGKAVAVAAGTGTVLGLLWWLWPRR